MLPTFQRATDQLYFLEDDENFVVVPSIRGMPVPIVVSSIRRRIAAIPDMEDLLRCVCEIYAFLLKEGAIGPWVLYRLGNTERKDEATRVIRYSEGMDFNRGFVYSKNATRERTHLRALVQETDNASAGCEIYCFCFWSSLVYAPVYRPPVGYSFGQIEVIEKMLGDDPVAVECGIYEELNLAYQEATLEAYTQDDEEW